MQLQEHITWPKPISLPSSSAQTKFCTSIDNGFMSILARVVRMVASSSVLPGRSCTPSSRTHSDFDFKHVQQAAPPEASGQGSKKAEVDPNMAVRIKGTFMGTPGRTTSMNVGTFRVQFGCNRCGAIGCGGIRPITIHRSFPTDAISTLDAPIDAPTTYTKAAMYASPSFIGENNRDF